MNESKSATISKRYTLQQFVSIFLSFRKASTGSLKPYINRLEQSLSPNKETVHLKPTKTVLNDSLKLKFDAKSFLSLLKQLPLYWTQYRRLKRIVLQKSSGFILATSSSRLYKDKSGALPSDYYKTVLQGFINDEERYLIADKMDRADYVCLVDTDEISPLWKFSLKSKRSNLLILDKSFIYFYSILNFRTTILAVVNWIYCRLRKRSSLIYAATYFNQQYDAIFDVFSDVSGLLLTSNSFNIEILRYNLIKRESSSSIIELMHGIPSKQVQNYFSDLINFEDTNFKTEKLAFTTQIPSINKSVLSKQNERVLKKISINTNFNAYLNTSVKNAGNLVSTFEKKIKDIYNSIPKSIDFNENVIILFVGGREHDQNFFNSQTFSVEKKIIDLILNFFSEERIAASVIYSVHPYNKTVPNDIDRFNSGEVIFISDVLLGSIAADACTGLVSSSLFEAGYLGLPTFIPMKVEDDLFPKELLELISFDSEDSTQSSLFEFLTEIALHKRLNNQERLDRVKERIQLL